MRQKFKRTTPLHVIAGIFAAGLYNWFPGLSITLMVSFGVFEWWQGQRIHDTGYEDFWQGLLGYFIGAGIILVLKLKGVV